MICKKCGTENNEAVKYCASCGAPLTEPLSDNDIQQGSQPEPEAAQAEQTQAPPPQNPQPQYTPPAGGYNPYNQSPQNMPVVLPGKNEGIAALVFSILSLLSCCVFYFAIPCGIAGLVLGCISFSKAKKLGATNNMALASIICSALGILLGLILLVLMLIGMFAMEFTNEFSDFYDYLG